ncbi:hypothetical protein HHI36_018974 [Cryptolaemus montrouzieri]|uniref:G-protein coupled receptors family 1 profile domain-containing protein n=1 Tax=Cryptolaemus montrouzieri TaxID=559131 RepID=A0ABD2P222_9CUCU
MLLWFIPSMFVIVLYTVEGGPSFWKAMIEDNLIESQFTITNINSTVYINQTSGLFNETFTNETDTSYLHIDETYIHQGKNHIRFIETFRFRMAVGSFVLISMLLIGICYLWILKMIKHQRMMWKDLSRTGSTVWRGHNCRHVSKQKTHEQNKIKGNFRAVYTTLIILGSCFMGWMPALLLYTLTCSQDCFISGELLEKFNQNYPRHIVMVRFFDNEMLFLKMIANPIIYSIRMREIKEGTRQMHNVVMHHLCGREWKSRNDRHSKSFLKSNNSTHSHVALTSLKSEKGDSEKCKKTRQTLQTSYL